MLSRREEFGSCNRVLPLRAGRAPLPWNGLGAPVRDTCVQWLLTAPVTGLGLVTGESRFGINTPSQAVAIAFLATWRYVGRISLGDARAGGAW